MKSPTLQSKAASFVSIPHTEISHDRSQRFHGSKMVHIQFMEKKNIKTKKESIALETYILLKKKSAKLSRYNNPLILITYYCSLKCLNHLTLVFLTKTFKFSTERAFQTK